MTSKEKSLLLSCIIGTICFIIWKVSGVSLSHEMPTDYSIMPHPTANTIKEKIIYFIISILLSTCFYFPFYLSKRYSKLRIAIGATLSIVSLFIVIGYISSNTKGLLLSNWFGEDYGFGENMIKLFFGFPVFYFFFNKLIFIDFPKRNLIYLFMMSFAIYFIAKLISYPNLDGIVTTIRYVLVDGYFIFFYAIGFGLIGINKNKITYIDDDKILDSDFNMNT